MLRTRVIPCLLLQNECLVKTIRFRSHKYIGDPVNTVWIFNDMEVDEIIFLDITATREKRRPNFKILEEIASECFIPLTYGGGIRDINDVKTIFNIGIEKIVINSFAFEDPRFITRCADIFGSQSIVVSVDVKKNIWGKYEVFSGGGLINTKKDPVEWSRIAEQSGAGELFITSIDRDGTWNGYDIPLLKNITSAVHIPVIACGGAGSVNDFISCVKNADVSAVAAGSIFVYQKKDMGVLINYFSEMELTRLYRSINEK